MTKGKKQVIVAASFVALLILIDQIIKVYVKTHFYLGEDIEVAPWFHLIFVENNGMAFGMEFFGKLFLTGFRIFAMFFIIWYLAKRITSGIKWSYLMVVCLVLAGAVGNIIDCVFYGEIFSSSGYYNHSDSIAHFVPFGEGYGSVFQGLVVDMFQFPLVDWVWPEWIPVIGGKYFLFFSPIFNFADSCITCGIFALILFFRKEISQDEFLNGKKSNHSESEVSD